VSAALSVVRGRFVQLKADKVAGTKLESFKGQMGVIVEVPRENEPQVLLLDGFVRPIPLDWLTLLASCAPSPNR